MIIPYLQGRAFRPELTDAINTLLERVCSELGLRLSDPKRDSTIEVIADQIIKLAERCVTNQATLYRAIVVELAQNLREENERLLRLALKLTEKVDALQNRVGTGRIGKPAKS